LFEHAKCALNKKDSDNCGNALPEERKRNSVFEEIIHPATIAPSMPQPGVAGLPDILSAIIGSTKRSPGETHLDPGAGDVRTDVETRQLKVISAPGLFFTPRIPSRRDHLQVVDHRKYAGDAVGAKSGQVLVGLTVYDAFQGDAAILHALGPHLL
jgi:hypothetical protein